MTSFNNHTRDKSNSLSGFIQLLEQKFLMKNWDWVVGYLIREPFINSGKLCCVVRGQGFDRGIKKWIESKRPETHP